MKGLRAMMSSANQRWGTPRPFYEWLDRQFGFTVDACADRWNTKHKRYWDKRADARRQSWLNETAFMNPEYAMVREMMARARRAALRERAISVCLVPARVDTKWWRESVLGIGGENAGRFLASRYVQESNVWWLRFEGLTTGYYFHHKRLNFEGDRKGESAPFPSAVVIHVADGQGGYLSGRTLPHDLMINSLAFERSHLRRSA